MPRASVPAHPPEPVVTDVLDLRSTALDELTEQVQVLDRLRAQTVFQHIVAAMNSLCEGD